MNEHLNSIKAPSKFCSGVGGIAFPPSSVDDFAPLNDINKSIAELFIKTHASFPMKKEKKMAFAWVRVENLLRNYYDCGEMIIGMAATRVTRDRDEFRRLAPPRTVEVALGTIDLVEAVVFFVSAIIVLTTSSEESPHNPMRFWIAGYAFQCIIHLAWLYMHQYPRRLSRSIKCVSSSLSLCNSFFGQYLDIRKKLYKTGKKIHKIKHALVTFSLYMALSLMAKPIFQS